MIKKATLLFTLLIIHSISGQSYHIAIAENDLNIRNAPQLSAEKVGKLYFGAKVEIVAQTGISLTVQEAGKDLQGEWVKVKFSNFPIQIASVESGYVFNGFLKPVDQLLAELQQEIDAITAFQGFHIDSSKTPFVIKGDFLGDQVSDYAILLKKEGEAVKLGILDKGGQQHQIPQSFQREKEALSNDLGFVGVFRKAPRGEALWANYVDGLEESEGFRTFEEVPKNERFILKYDALYVHAAESCGGGYIYWNKEKFIWLQQE
jgi:hypothetical protein